MKYKFIVITLLVHSTILSQIDSVSQFLLTGTATKEKITIDGLLNESLWNTSEKAVFSQEHYPQNGRAPLMKSEAMVSHDDAFLYVAFICEDKGNTYVIQTLKRDFELSENDAVSILIDPVGLKNTAYFFAVSAQGVQGESILNRFDEDVNWDTKWYSAVKNEVDRWTVEMAIPLHIIKHDPKQATWRINFIRSDIKNFRFYTWTKIPQQFDGIDIGYLGELNWQENIKGRSGAITTIPYINGNTYTDLEEPQNSVNKLSFGGDAKITVTPTVNLDLTLNPDFSQVEVDRQQTNLTRFNLFFPERRNFFLENADLLGQFGDPQNPIFFSRRIGLDENGKAVPIIGGARINGTLGNSWRIGGLTMQTKKTDDQKGQNYSAFTLHKTLLKRSLIKGLFTNRQAIDGSTFSGTDYGRNISIESVYQNNEGNVFSWLGLHKSFKQGLNDKNTMVSTGGFYSNRKFFGLVGMGYTGDNYTADMGFINQLDNYDAVRDTVIKIGYYSMFNRLQFTHWTPNHSKTNFHSLSLFSNVKYNPSFGITEWLMPVEYEINYKSSQELSFNLLYNFTQLIFPFSFTDEGIPLPAANYSFANGGLSYSSDVRKTFVWGAKANIGKFYNGQIKSFTISTKYRAQPWGNFEMNLEYNDLLFPQKYGRAQFLLINPRIEINFSKTLFWTTFLQYNTQADNFNINSRLQWRYAPMSDIFLVYTDNHAVQTWGPKNRSAVLKINYWLNL